MVDLKYRSPRNMYCWTWKKFSRNYNYTRDAVLAGSNCSHDNMGGYGCVFFIQGDTQYGVTLYFGNMFNRAVQDRKTAGGNISLQVASSQQEENEDAKVPDVSEVVMPTAGKHFYGNMLKRPRRVTWAHLPPLLGFIS